MIRTSIVCALGFWIGAASADESTSTISIGAVIDRSGPLARASWLDSLMMARDDVQAAVDSAGFPRVRFEYLWGDSKNNPDVAPLLALDLVHKGARALITESSHDDIAIHAMAYSPDMARRIAIPIVCMACTSPLINQPTAKDASAQVQAALRNSLGWNFRTVMSDDYTTRVIARLIRRRRQSGELGTAGHLKVSIYASDDLYGRAFCDALKRELLLSGGQGLSIEQIFQRVNIDASIYDWRRDAGRLVDRFNETTGREDGPPDVIVEATFPKFARDLTRAFVEIGSKVPLLHTHHFRSARVTTPAGDRVDGDEGIVQSLLGPNESARSFDAELRQRTGFAPATGDSAAYDAAMVLMLAALESIVVEGTAPAAVTGEKMRVALTRINRPDGRMVGAGPKGVEVALRAFREGKPINYDGASGPCDFDQWGNVLARLTRFRIDKGNVVDLETYDCIQSDECPVVSKLP